MGISPRGWTHIMSRREVAEKAVLALVIGAALIAFLLPSS
jgi:hypothetical protein